MVMLLITLVTPLMSVVELGDEALFRVVFGYAAQGDDAIRR